MRIECPHCQHVFNITDERLPKRDEFAFPCPTCKKVIDVDLRARNGKHDEGLDPVSPFASSPDTELKGDALKNKILRSVSDLPPMPQTVIRAQQIMRDSSSSFEELARVLETDQAVAAKVLKLANSPYYGMMGKISSLQHASVVLGQKTLEELITIAGTSHLLGGKLKGYKLDSGDLWQHSMGVAFGAKLIARKKHPRLENDAFAAGLIHDVGKLILDPYVLERTAAFEAVMNDGKEGFTKAEKRILGFDHAELAFELCKKWNVPQPLRIAVLYHHAPTLSSNNPLAFIVHAADALTMMSGIGVGLDGMQYQVDEKAIEYLGLRDVDASETMAGLVEGVQDISMQMEID